MAMSVTRDPGLSDERAIAAAAFVREQQRLEGVAPTVRECAVHFGFSPSAMQDQLDRAVELGLLTKAPRFSARGYRAAVIPGRCAVCGHRLTRPRAS